MAKMCLAFSANLEKTQTDIGILTMSRFHSTRRDNLSFAFPRVYFKEKSPKIEYIQIFSDKVHKEANVNAM